MPITLPTTAKKKVITIRAGQLIGKASPNILKRVDGDSEGGPAPKLLVTRCGGIPISSTSRNTVSLRHCVFCLKLFAFFYTHCIMQDTLLTYHSTVNSHPLILIG